MVLYGTNLFLLAKELRTSDLGLVSPFYADNAEFDGLARRSEQLLKLLMEIEPDRGYLPDPAKSLFISDNPGQKEEAMREFVTERLEIDFISGSRHQDAYLSH